MLGDEIVCLPLPRKATTVSVEEAVLMRRSVRDYSSEPVRLEDLSLILWSAYGVTHHEWPLRSAPSAGATYPLEIYAVAGERGVSTGGGYLPAGSYKYNGLRHLLKLVKRGDLRADLYSASLRQSWVKRAPLSLVICAVFERTASLYGARGRARYVPMEVGHAGQNVYLMATALGYGTVAVGAFDDRAVSETIGAEGREVPMYIMPIGVPRERPAASFESVSSRIERERRASVR